MKTLIETDLYTLVEGRHGRFLANPKDRYIGRSMLTYGEFSEAEVTLFQALLKPGMVAVEAGANMGAHTVPMARRLGRNGILYAFEPQLAIFQQMCANLALNDLVNVQAFNAGLGAESAWMGIVRPDPARDANFGGFTLEALTGGKQTRIRVERLDEVLDPPKLHLLKADVEGMEVDVLKGAAGLIAAHRPVLYLEANVEHAPGIIAHVQDLDYEAWWHLPPLFNPKNHAGVSENIFGTITSKNIFCTPKERGITVEGSRRVTGPEDHPSRWHLERD